MNFVRMNAGVHVGYQVVVRVLLAFDEQVKAERPIEDELLYGLLGMDVAVLNSPIIREPRALHGDVPAHPLPLSLGGLCVGAQANGNGVFRGHLVRDVEDPLLMLQ